MKMELAPGEVLDIQRSMADRYSTGQGRVDRYMHYFMNSAWVTMHGRAVGMFYPVVTPGTRQITTLQARDMNRLFGNAMKNAQPYQVTAEMVDAMRGTYSNSVKYVEHIDLAEMPSENGFAWLDESWGIHDMNGLMFYVRVVQWEYMTCATSGTETDMTDKAVQDWPCVRITLWSHTDDDFEHEGESGVVGKLSTLDKTRTNAELGVMQIVHTAVIPFGLRFDKPDDDGVESFLGLVHILWMFMGMEISSVTRQRVARHFQRRALKTLKHGDVTVVLLRRISHITVPAAGHEHVDWSCRWVVQGHYRHVSPPEDYKPHRGVPVGVDRTCAACEGRLTWVAPYLKGPDGQPLKVSTTLMKLAR